VIHGHEGQRLERGQRSSTVSLAESGRVPGLPLERDESARLPGAHAEPLGQVAPGGREEHQSIQAAIEECPEKPAGLPIDPVHGANDRQHALVEHARIEVVDALREVCHVVRDGVDDRRPVELGEDASVLVTIGRHLGGRRRRGPRLAARGACRQSFGCDRFRGLTQRQVIPGHPPSELDDVAPEPDEPRRTTKPESCPRLVVVAVPLVTRPRGTLADARRKRAHRSPARAMQPVPFGVRRRHADEQPRLRPRQVSGCERATDAGQTV